MSNEAKKSKLVEINNERLEKLYLFELHNYKEGGRPSSLLAMEFMRLIEVMIRKKNVSTRPLTFLEHLKDAAIDNVLKYWHKYDPERGKPFSYLANLIDTGIKRGFANAYRRGVEGGKIGNSLSISQVDFKTADVSLFLDERLGDDFFEVIGYKKPESLGKKIHLLNKVIESHRLRKKALEYMKSKFEQEYDEASLEYQSSKGILKRMLLGNNYRVEFKNIDGESKESYIDAFRLEVIPSELNNKKLFYDRSALADTVINIADSGLASRELLIETLGDETGLKGLLDSDATLKILLQNMID